MDSSGLLIVCLMMIGTVNANEKIYLKMISYSNPSDKTAKGEICDTSFFGGSCDPLFVFCFKRRTDGKLVQGTNFDNIFEVFHMKYEVNTKSYTDKFIAARICPRANCHYNVPEMKNRSNSKTCDLGTTSTTSFDNEKSIHFGQLMGGLPNPIPIHIVDKWKGQIFISIDVKDSDFGGEEEIETFQQYFKATPAKPSIPLTLQGKRVKLVVKFSVGCDPHYYGVQCSIICVPTNNMHGHYKCAGNGKKICYKGWTGSLCNQRIRYCKATSCNSHGHCTEGVGSFHCKCTAGFTGKSCQKNIDDCQSAPCQNHGTCHDDINAYHCACAAGFTGRRCEDVINACALNPCNNNSTCSASIGTYHCSCANQFTGRQCESQVSNIGLLTESTVTSTSTLSVQTMTTTRTYLSSKYYSITTTAAYSSVSTMLYGLSTLTLSTVNNGLTSHSYSIYQQPIKSSNVHFSISSSRAVTQGLSSQSLSMKPGLYSTISRMAQPTLAYSTMIVDQLGHSSLTYIPSMFTSTQLLPTSTQLLPTIQPSSSLLPTIQPSSSLLPTIQPSSSLLPTIQPSSSLLPTIQPSSSLLPTIQPSSSLLPTIQPSSSLLPTIQPSSSLLPTIQPSSSLLPTIQPSSSLPHYSEGVDLTTNKAVQPSIYISVSGSVATHYLSVTQTSPLLFTPSSVAEQPVSLKDVKTKSNNSVVQTIIHISGSVTMATPLLTTTSESFNGNSENSESLISSYQIKASSNQYAISSETIAINSESYNGFHSQFVFLELSSRPSIHIGAQSSNMASNVFTDEIRSSSLILSERTTKSLDNAGIKSSIHNSESSTTRASHNLSNKIHNSSPSIAATSTKSETELLLLPSLSPSSALVITTTLSGSTPSVHHYTVHTTYVVIGTLTKSQFTHLKTILLSYFTLNTSLKDNANMLAIVTSHTAYGSNDQVVTVVEVDITATDAQKTVLNGLAKKFIKSEKARALNFLFYEGKISSEKPKTGPSAAIIGGGVGGGVVLLIFIVLIIVCQKKRKMVSDLDLMNDSSITITPLNKSTMGTSNTLYYEMETRD